MTTWSPTDKDDLATLSNGNLTVTGTDTVNGPMKAFATAGKASGAGKFYWEITVGLLRAGSAIIVGITGPTRSSRFDAPGKSDSLGVSWQSGGYNTANGTETYVPASAYTTGDKLGLALDTASGKLDCYKNGSLVWSATTAFTSYLPFIAPFNNDNGTANFGASAAANSPPSGYTLYDAAAAGRAASAASTLAMVGASASSKAAVAALAASVIGGVVSQAVGKVLALAAGAAALQPIGATASAQLAASGASAITLGDVAGSASGAPVPAAGASVATTLAPIQSVASGQVSVAGVASSSIGQIDANGAGAAAIVAVAASTMDAVASAATGQAQVAAVVANHLGAVAGAAQAGAQASLVASAASVLADVAATSSGQAPISAAGSVVLHAVSGSSSGAAAPVRAAAATPIGEIVGVSVGRLAVSAVGAAQIAALGSDAATRVVVRASVSAALATITGTANGTGDDTSFGGVPGPNWTLATTPRRFTASVTPRRFTASSTGKKRMVRFPGKYAHEVRHASIDFASALASDETLSGAPTAVAVRGDVGIAGGKIEGTEIRFTLSGGKPLTTGPLRDRATHLIAVYCATSTGQVLEELVSVEMLSHVVEAG